MCMHACECVPESLCVHLRVVGIQGRDERRGQASALEVGTAQSRADPVCPPPAGAWLFLSESCSLRSRPCSWNTLWWGGGLSGNTYYIV